VFGLKRRLPSRARPALTRDERVVAWARTADAPPRRGRAERDGVVIVTTQGMWLPGRAERLGWHQVHKATWAGSRLTVTPSTQIQTGQGYAVMADGEQIVVGLANPADVPAEVRTRVTRSVAYTAHHEVPGGGVRVVARRIPGLDGVSWHVRYDPGTDPSDPEVRSATEEYVAVAAATTGWA
jgi:hypothetical protein